ncbi:immunoglobulin-like domain-containing protein, partial [Enterococcus hirae]|uniref:immunoglobulin-like domain-containing protein n=1 Tax=Enterococcus hirae TaxID=1354 RepID=UPI001F609F5E
INAAKAKVDALTDSKTKTELLAKIDTAQKALDAVTQETAKVKEATEAVNALFNGDTPKPENTQDQINAAKAKVDALTDSKTKTELLAKIDTAQKALDESQKFKITNIDPYIEGESQFVSGKCTGKGAAYIRITVNGNKKALVSMVGLPQGTFKYYVAGLKASDKVTVQIFDSSYKQLAEEALTVKKAEPVKITNIDPYIEGKSQYITGKYTGDTAKYVQVIVNGKKQTLVPLSSQSSGSFKYYLPGLKTTDKASVALYDSSYKLAAEKSFVITK